MVVLRQFVMLATFGILKQFVAAVVASAGKVVGDVSKSNLLILGGTHIGGDDQSRVASP